MSVAIVSLHDVAPATSTQLDRMLDLTDGFPRSLLVVAGPWRGSSLSDAPQFAERVRSLAAAGDEVVVHGWEHAGPTGMPASLGLMVGRLLARGCEEFWAVDEDEARRRIELALCAFDRAGLRPTGFVAPGWLSSPGTMAALRSLQMDFVASHAIVHNLAVGRRSFVPVVSQRPGGRSQAVCAGAAERFVRMAAAIGAPIRVAIHPGDMDHADCVKSVRSSLEVLRNRGYRFTTYGGYVDGQHAPKVGRGSSHLRAAA